MHAMLMLGGAGGSDVAEGRVIGRLRARCRAAGARLRDDVRDPLAIRVVARPARAPRPGRTHGADQLPHPHRRRLTVFYGIGFGLMGRLGPVWWPLMVVAMISAQIAFCRWWLARFAFGPMEWIWRQATYGRGWG